MRLINADRIMETVKALENMTGDYADSFTNMAGNRAIEFDRLEDHIENAPTVDAKPVIHAHWIRTAIDYGSKGYIRCSNCGADFSLPVHKMQGFYQRYCGACGARMDENETD